MSCVYVHRNKVNGKCYVGKTSIEPRLRWGYGYGYSSNKKFFPEIKQFGWDNFTHEILADNLTEDEACELEKYYIKEFDSIANGYNTLSGGRDVAEACAMGGQATAEKLMRPVCQYDIYGNLVAEYRGANEAARLWSGRKRDTGIVQVCNGIGGTAHGYVWRYKGDPFDKYDVEALKQATSVWMCDRYGNKIRKFEKLTDAERETGASHGDILRCCKGQRHTAGGYAWRYGHE